MCQCRAISEKFSLTFKVAISVVALCFHYIHLTAPTVKKNVIFFFIIIFRRNILTDSVKFLCPDAFMFKELYLKGFIQC